MTSAVAKISLCAKRGVVGWGGDLGHRQGGMCRLFLQTIQTVLTRGAERGFRSPLSNATPRPDWFWPADAIAASMRWFHVH